MRTQDIALPPRQSELANSALVAPDAFERQLVGKVVGAQTAIERAVTSQGHAEWSKARMEDRKNGTGDPGWRSTERVGTTPGDVDWKRSIVLKSPPTAPGREMPLTRLDNGELQFDMTRFTIDQLPPTWQV